MPKVGFGPNVGLDQTDLRGREKASACQVWRVGPMPLQAFNGVDRQAWRGRHACFSAIPLSARGEGGVSSRVDKLTRISRRVAALLRRLQGVRVVFNVILER